MDEVEKEENLYCTKFFVKDFLISLLFDKHKMIPNLTILKILFGTTSLHLDRFKLKLLAKITLF